MTDISEIVARPGANDVEYEDPALPGHPFVLRSARPRHFTPDTPVVFVHHGVLRNGGDYRDFWLPLVDEADVLAIVPEFSATAFPGSAWYNFGNRTDTEGKPKPRGEWTYGVDGRIFSALREHGITRRGGYGMFGHSAGGQFVHRLISLGFRDHVITAVTANAGTYAMPDLSTPFPFGLGNTGMDDAALRDLLSYRLTVSAGTLDIDTADEHFPKDEAAMRQGATRYERAHSYIATARAQAQRLEMHCAWTIIDVAGVDHDGNRMSAAAAPILAAALHAAPN
jgi:hypothetical protein